MTVMLVGDVMSGKEIVRLLTELTDHKVFRYSSVSELPLRLFHVRKYRMRCFFEEQGKWLRDMGDLQSSLSLLPAEPLRVSDLSSTFMLETDASLELLININEF